MAETAPTKKTTSKKVNTRTVKGSKGTRTITDRIPIEVDDDEEEEQQDFTPRSAFFGSNPFNTNKNSLPHLFDILAEDGEETYTCHVQRLVDLPSDQWAKPCHLSPMTFAPFTLQSDSAPQFVGMLQRFNGNSGGRFHIVISDQQGNLVDGAEIKNFSIPDPLQGQQQQTGNSGEVVELMREMQRQQQEFNEKLIALNQPKDEMDTLERMLRINAMLNQDKPKEPEPFNPNKIYETLFTSSQFIDNLASKFATETPPPEDKNAWLEFLESDTGKTIASQAMGALGQVASVLATRAQAQKQQGSAPVQNPDQPQPQQVEVNGELNEPSPAEQQQAVNMKNLIDDIIDELNSDRKLDDSNKFIEELSFEYPAVLPTLQMACKTQEFEQVYAILETIVPETFSEYKTKDGNLNAKGKKLKARLNEFYEHIKTLP